MLSLHASSSPALTFHCSTSQPKAGVLHAVTAAFLSHRLAKSMCVSYNSNSSLSSVTARAASAQADSSAVSCRTAETDVLKALSLIIDPDFGTDIVSCGFVKDLLVNGATGEVSFRLELTTPACPIKDMFEKQANEVVGALPWVKRVNVTMSAQPAKPIYAADLPIGLQRVSNIVAVSSCKGGVGKSTIAVNLAYTLAGMGARVGLFDADVYGPSLPTMVSPENRLLEMNPEKKTIIPTEYLGVKLVSFGFAGQGRAIMRGPMVSGVIDQLLTTTEWGELDYLLVDMPPGTGDIQLTLCQVVPLTAAVIATTPQLRRCRPCPSSIPCLLLQTSIHLDLFPSSLLTSAAHLRCHFRCESGSFIFSKIGGPQVTNNVNTSKLLSYHSPAYCFAALTVNPQPIFSSNCCRRRRH